jgi:glutamine synthetase
VDGIERRLDPGPPGDGDLEKFSSAQASAAGLRPLPATLLHAVDELTADGVLRAGLGKVPGGEYVDYYASVKRDEFLSYHAQVSDWEVQRYLTAV